MSLIQLLNHILKFAVTPFLYDKWKDVLVFKYAGNGYLVQARKNKLTRKTQFRIGSSTPFSCTDCGYLTEQHMKDAGVWE